MLRKAVQVQPERWEQVLPSIPMADRCTPSEDTGHAPQIAHRASNDVGCRLRHTLCRPASIFESFATDLVSTGERAYEQGRKNLGYQGKREKEYYDCRSVDQMLQAGDLVRPNVRSRSLGTPTKFAPNWSGLQEVGRSHGPLVFMTDPISAQEILANPDSVLKSSLSWGTRPRRNGTPNWEDRAFG